MSFFYRGTTSPREDHQMPSYANPLSPPRNPNRLSGGMAPSNNVGNDIRSGLTRRFTTNALPTLSPIGQQRKQAAGDYTVRTLASPSTEPAAASGLDCGTWDIQLGQTWNRWA